MFEHNWSSMICRIISIFAILLLWNLVDIKAQCAIENTQQYHEKSEWMDSRGQLKYDIDDVLSDNCYPCETKAEKLQLTKTTKTAETNIVCYVTESNSTVEDICNWNNTNTRKFPNVGLKILSLTKYKITEWFHIDQTFEELTELEYLYLESNHITGWNVSGNHTKLTKLEVLSLANNPIVSLSNQSFIWLEGSNLKFLNLRGCSGMKILDDKVLHPLRKSSLRLDLSFTIIEPSQLSSLTAPFRKTLNYDNKKKKGGLQMLSLSHTGLTKIPTEALKHVAHTLQKLSLQGNYFSNCWASHLEEDGNGTSDNETVTSHGEACALPTMSELNEINLIDSEISEFPCQILFNSAPKLEKLHLDSNPITKMSCSVENASITYLSLQMIKSDKVGLNLCSNGSKCIFPNLQTLDLSHSKVSSLNFENMTSLQTLSLCNSELQDVDNVFEPLENLQVLDLGFNNLSKNLEKPIFKGLNKLEELYLHSSLIQNITLASFKELTNLKILDMSNNFLRSLDDINFKDLKNIQKIIFKDNRLRPWKNSLFNKENNVQILDLRSNWFTDITEVMVTDFQYLQALDLSDNPFSCESCNVGRFFEHFRSKEVAILNAVREVYNFTLINWDKEIAYICMTKDNEQNFLSDPTIDNFCVLPTQPTTTRSTSLAVPTSDVSLTEESTIVTHETYGGQENNKPDLTAVYVLSALLACTLIGSGICYWKRWNIKMCLGFFKRNLELTMLKDKKKKPSNKSYQYDVFLSYSDKNRDWILEQLIPNLEQQSNIKVCLHERDFQAGLPVLENIMACMDHSRCVLLILSESFLRSHWCQFELNLAQHRLLELQHDRLILVLLENIPREKCSKMLRYLMLTKTYLLWPVKDNEEDRKIFWRQLRKAIGPIQETVNVSFA